jgi:hypothetical protein
VLACVEMQGLGCCIVCWHVWRCKVWDVAEMLLKVEMLWDVTVCVCVCVCVCVTIYYLS